MTFGRMSTLSSGKEPAFSDRFFRGSESYNVVVDLTPELKWTVHPRFSKVTIDGVVYAHGDSGRHGADAALAQAKDNFRSTVIGHFHSQAGAKWWANPEFRVFGLAVGCGIDVGRLQFEYGRRIVAKPILGCGVVINGRRASFEPWLLKAR